MSNGLDPLVRPDEQCVALTRDFQIVQRLKGHRFSVDDMLVANLLRRGSGRPQRVLDLGCGLGSVLLMTAWIYPDATVFGVEVQPEHVALARRNVLLNDCEQRARIISGDMREESTLVELERCGPFDLITGTPPYFDPSAATVCADPQRAAAHFEIRGGIETYALVAARLLADQALFVTCAAAEPRSRTKAAFREAGLAISSWQPVLPRPGKPPFLLLLQASREATGFVEEEQPLLLRDSEGNLTDEHEAIRRWFGISR